MNSSLALGTVQFGIPYGINNRGGIPSDTAVKEIFAAAISSGIGILDTAPAYGNAEERIGSLARGEFRVVTKFWKITSEESFTALLEQSLKKTASAQIYGYMAHNADDVLKDPRLWQYLRVAKEKQLVNKIGYSLYTPEQLSRLLDQNMVPEIVQIPYSLLDRKFEPCLAELKKMGCEIHVRSVFLQGLYFMDTEKLPATLSALKEPLQTLHALCEQAGTSIAALALNFVVLNKYIDQVVIGVEHADQLKENVRVLTGWKDDGRITEQVYSIGIKDPSLLNPANW